MQWNESKTHLRLLKMAKSSNGISKINGQDVQSHKLLVPSIAAQRKFLEGMAAKVDIKIQLQESIDMVSTLQHSLTNTLFGELWPSTNPTPSSR